MFRSNSTTDLYFLPNSALNRKFSLKNKRLNCLRTNKISFLFLGKSKTLSLGEFDES